MKGVGLMQSLYNDGRLQEPVLPRLERVSYKMHRSKQDESPHFESWKVKRSTLPESGPIQSLQRAHETARDMLPVARPHLLIILRC